MLQLTLLLAFVCPSPSPTPPPIPPPIPQVEIKTIPLRGGVYMLTGRGGNLGLSVGSRGAFLIDDQFAPLSGKIKSAIGVLTELPVEFLVNTHFHGDHTGGNENFGKDGAVIVAHRNVRERMSAEQFEAQVNRVAKAADNPALPVITFTDAMTFHWNGDEIRVFHVGNAHTDGDSIIHFVKADVFHMGDTFFNGTYPYIDAESGGTLDGILAAVGRVLDLANDETLIIPGHGPLAKRMDLVTYRELLSEVRLRLVDMIEAGMSTDEIVEARPTEEWDDSWGQGFMSPDKFVRIATETLRKK